jgi:hypothetical protein
MEGSTFLLAFAHNPVVLRRKAMTAVTFDQYLDRLRSSGPPFFTDRSVSEALGQPPKAFLADIVDMINAGDAVCPRIGFYVLAKGGVTSLAASPERWIPGYMEFLGIRYRLSHLGAVDHI